MSRGPERRVPIDVHAATIPRVLSNLLQNGILVSDVSDVSDASDASDPSAGASGGDVTLRARRAPMNVVVEVVDRGSGIPTANAPVVDAFFTTKSSDAELGVSIVDRIVTRRDGTIVFESRPGHSVHEIGAEDLPMETAPRMESAGLRIPGATMAELERVAILTTLEADAARERLRRADRVPGARRGAAGAVVAWALSWARSWRARSWRDRAAARRASIARDARRDGDDLLEFPVARAVLSMRP